MEKYETIFIFLREKRRRKKKGLDGLVGDVPGEPVSNYYE